MTDRVTIAERQLPDGVRKSIALFTGRRWVLLKLVEWWEQSDERLFLLTGDPGTGKSMVMAWLLGFGPEPTDPVSRAHLVRLRGAIKAAHFCQASSRNTTPQDFAQNIANQLVQTVPGFGEAFAASLADRVSIIGTAQAGTAEAGASLVGVSVALNLAGLGEESSFDRGFVQPLKKLFERGQNEPLLLIIDGLDEAQTHAGGLLPQLLSQHADWPRPVRILATSRNEPRILKFFRAAKPFDLIKDADPNIDDVLSYAEGRLSADARTEESKRGDFSRRLAEEAKGIFLYAALVLDQLLKLSLSEFPDLDTIALPKDLRGIYHEFLTRELGKDEERWFGLYEPLLGLIAVAQGEGLTANMLSDIIGKDIRMALRASKQYLTGEPPDGPFRPFHKSFSDFLFEEKDDYQIDATVWNNRIVDYYLSKFGTDWGTCDNYGLSSLAAHMSAAGRVGELVDLISQPWMQARFERSGLTYADFQSDVQLAWRAVMARPDARIDHLVHVKVVGYAIQENAEIYEDTDLPLMVDLGRSAQAVAHVRLRKAPKQKFDGFLSIIRALSAKNGDVLTLAEEAQGAANAIGDALDRVRSLCSLARTVKSSAPSAATRILGELPELIRGIHDEGQNAQAERGLASALVALGKLSDASSVALAIKDTLQQAFALKDVAIGFAESGQFSMAEAAAGRINREYTWSTSSSAIQRTYGETLAEIASRQSIAKDPGAAATFEAAEQASLQCTEKFDCDQALYDLAVAQILSSRLDEAERVACSIRGWRKDTALILLAQKHAESASFDKALSLLDMIKDARFRSKALSDVACELARVGRYEKARSLQKRLITDARRVHGLLSIADILIAVGDAHAQAVLDESIERAEALTGKERQDAIRHLTRILIRAGDNRRAEAAFGRIQPEKILSRNPRQFCGVLREMGVALARIADRRADDFFEFARQNIQRVDTTWRGLAKRNLATSLSETGRFDDAWNVLETASEDWQVYREWATLAARLGECEDERTDNALANALSVAGQIANVNTRDEALVDLCAALADQHRFRMMEDVAMWVKDLRHRSVILSAVACALHKTEPTHSKELFALAERMAREVWSEYQRGEALSALVLALGDVSEFEGALRIVATIASDSDRITALSGLAARLALAGDPRGTALFERALGVGSDDGIPEAWPEIQELRREATALEQSQDPSADSLWRQANERAGSLWASWTWGKPQYRARYLIDIVANLSRARDPKWREVFQIACAAAMKIPHERARDETLRTFITKMIAESRLDAAKTILDDLHGEDQRLAAIRLLVSAFLEAHQLDAAWRTARLVSSDYYRPEVIRQVAVALAKASQMPKAIEILEEATLDSFIEALGETHAAWGDPPPGAITASLSAAARVAAWVRSDWVVAGVQLQV